MLLNSSIGLNHRTKIKRSSTDIDQRKSYVRISVLLIRHMTKKLACWHIISIRLLLYKSTHQTNVNKKESNSTELAYYAEKSGKEENDKNLSIVLNQILFVLISLSVLLYFLLQVEHFWCCYYRCLHNCSSSIIVESLNSVFLNRG
jgi:hypothetical protein